MFDFRYHALSLMAVFIALAVGLLLGVAIGDEELVSSAKNDLRDSLRADVRQANQERDDARDDLARERQFIDDAYPALVGNRLNDRRIGVVLLGANAESTVDDVREALEPTGASIELVAVQDRLVDRAELAERAAGTRYEDVATNPALLTPLGRRLGIQMVEGGQLIGRVRSSIIGPFSGGFGALDGVVIVRTERDKVSEQAREELEALQDGIVDGLAEVAPVVGAEQSDTEPSEIAWYRDHGVSSVDNVDERAGRTALVYVLAGAEGRFGRKDTAEALLPAVVAPTAGRSGAGG